MYKFTSFDDSVQRVEQLFLVEFICFHPNISVDIYWASHAGLIIRFKSISPKKIPLKQAFYYSCFTDEEIEIYWNNLLEVKQLENIRARI